MSQSVEETTPFFSAVIITYNRLPLLKKAVESILSQSETDFELIIVDNHSTDGTADWVNELGVRDPRVRLEMIHNDGVIARSRNLGIAKARGRYVAFLDSDDEWMPDKLLESRALLEQNPDAIGLCHGEFHDNGTDRKPVHYGPYDNNLTKQMLTKGSKLSPSASVISTQAYRVVEGFSEQEDVVTAEDYDTWIKLSRLGRILYLRQMLGVFRIHDDNMSGNLIRNYNSAQRVVISQIDEEIKSSSLSSKVYWSLHKVLWKLRFSRLIWKARLNKS
ncbi:MAG: glycosyltransferase family 2 protein [Acidobacteriota bacterium]